MDVFFLDRYQARDSGKAVIESSGPRAMSLIFKQTWAKMQYRLSGSSSYDKRRGE